MKFLKVPCLKIAMQKKYHQTHLHPHEFHNHPGLLSYSLTALLNDLPQRTILV